MNQNLNIRVCGKWILAGEYAVLKGFSALAFPLLSQFMELKFFPSKEKKLHTRALIHTASETRSKEKLQAFFESVFQEALKIVSKQSSQVTGLLELNSYILSGSGLGSSAVVSVLIGKLFYALEWIKKEELFSFCHALERYLQKGESSGLDIRVILERQAILYKNPSHWEFFLSGLGTFYLFILFWPGAKYIHEYSKYTKTLERRTTENERIESKNV